MITNLFHSVFYFKSVKHYWIICINCNIGT